MYCSGTRGTLDQRCPWVGLTHWSGRVGSRFEYRPRWVWLGQNRHVDNSALDNRPRPTAELYKYKCVSVMKIVIFYVLKLPKIYQSPLKWITEI